MLSDFSKREIVAAAWQAAAGHSRLLYRPSAENGKNRKKSVRATKRFLESFIDKVVSDYSLVAAGANLKEIENFIDWSKSAPIVKDTVCKAGIPFGVAQKCINLILKYLWQCGAIPTAPPHCPIDSKVLDKWRSIKQLKSCVEAKGVEFPRSWQAMCKHQYVTLIQCAEKFVPSNLAGWELDFFESKRFS